MRSLPHRACRTALGSRSRPAALAVPVAACRRSASSWGAGAAVGWRCRAAQLRAWRTSSAKLPWQRRTNPGELLGGRHGRHSTRALSSTAESGDDVDDQSQPPSLPLQMLVKAGDTAAIVAYLEHEPAAVDRGDPALSGTTPLLLALRLGRDEAAEVLLDGGADLNLAGAWGLTPLMYAAVFGRKQAVASMLRRGGASVEVHATDVHGSTALVHAQAERQHAIVELLVEHLDKYGGGASPSGRPAEAAATHSSQSGFNIQPMVRSVAPILTLHWLTAPLDASPRADCTRYHLRAECRADRGCITKALAA